MAFEKDKAFVTNKFEEYRESYDPFDPLSTVNAAKSDAKKFKENVVKEITEIGKLKLLKGKLKLLAMLKSLDIVKMFNKLDPKGLLDNFKDGFIEFSGKQLNNEFIRTAIGLSIAIDKLSGDTLSKYVSGMVSKIHIPEALFLANIKALHLAGGDLEYADSYIRKISIQHDMVNVLKYINNVKGVKYTGLNEDPYNRDGRWAARNGSLRCLDLIMSQYHSNYTSLNRNLGQFREDSNTYAELSNGSSIIRERIVSLMKRAITDSRVTLTVPALNNFLFRYNIPPYNFGDNDLDYGRKYTLTKGDVDKLAPEIRDVSMEDGVTYFYTVPSNPNIKRLYVHMSDHNTYGDKRIINDLLKERLKLPVNPDKVTFTPKAMDEGNGEFQYGKGNSVETNRSTAAYMYTLTIEDFLFDSSMLEYVQFSDKGVIPTLTSVPDKGVIDDTEDEVTKRKRKKSNPRKHKYDNDIGIQIDKWIIPDDYPRIPTTIVTPTIINKIIIPLITDSVPTVPYIKTVITPTPTDIIQAVVTSIVTNITNTNYNTTINSSVINGNNIYINTNGDVTTIFTNIVDPNIVDINTVIDKLLERIENNIYSKTILKEVTLDVLVNTIIKESIDNGIYTEVKNNSTDIATIKVTLDEMKNLIDKYTKNLITKDDFPTKDELLTMVKNEIAKGGVIIDNTNMELIISKVLERIKKDGLKDQVFEEIQKEVTKQLKDSGIDIRMQNSEDEIAKIKAMLAYMNSLVTGIMNGTIRIADVPTMDEVRKYAKDFVTSGQLVDELTGIKEVHANSIAYLNNKLKEVDTQLNDTMSKVANNSIKIAEVDTRLFDIEAKIGIIPSGSKTVAERLSDIENKLGIDISKIIGPGGSTNINGGDGANIPFGLETLIKELEKVLDLHKSIIDKDTDSKLKEIEKNLSISGANLDIEGATKQAETTVGIPSIGSLADRIERLESLLGINTVNSIIDVLMDKLKLVEKLTGIPITLNIPISTGPNTSMDGVGDKFSINTIIKRLDDMYGIVIDTKDMVSSISKIIDKFGLDNVTKLSNLVGSYDELLKLSKDTVLTVSNFDDLMTDRIKEMFDNWIKGKLSTGELLGLNELTKKIREELSGEEALKIIRDGLKKLGLEDDDSIEEMRKLDEKLHNSDKGFFEFDIDDPKVKNSIAKEIIDHKNGRIVELSYIWTDKYKLPVKL